MNAVIIMANRGGKEMPAELENGRKFNIGLAFGKTKSLAKLDRTLKKGVEDASIRLSKELSKSFGEGGPHSGVRREPLHRAAV